MNIITIKPHNHSDFLDYLGEHISQQPDTHDIHKFYIDVDTDNQTTIKPGLGEYHWIHKGESFLIQYKEEGNAKSTGHYPMYFTRLTVQHPNIILLKEFLTTALTYQKETEERKINIWHCRSKGYWDKFGSTYAQRFEEIFLPQNLKNDIIHRIDTFISSEQHYIKYGRPYKLTFMMMGVPGAGKSSLVKSIAQRYNKRLYVLSFTKSLTDESLVDLMKDIHDGSILLIEDIDAFFQERKAQDINISFSALLNVLDGSLVKSNGTLIFMTANHPENLDTALYRPGRVDQVYKFDWPQSSEIKLAFFELTENPTEEKYKMFAKGINNVRINMSGIIDFLFRFPVNYIEHLPELLQQSQILKEISQGDKVEKLYL